MQRFLIQTKQSSVVVEIMIFLEKGTGKMGQNTFYFFQHTLLKQDPEKQNNCNSRRKEKKVHNYEEKVTTAYTSLCVHVPVCVHCVCIWRSEVDIHCLPQLFSILFLGSEFLNGLGAY